MAAVSAQAIAIAVIGVTGSGKSSFINLASGSNLPVGQPRGSCTTLESSTFSLDGRTVTLIDTPGFDDTTPSVLHVLKLISDHFAGLYRQGVKFAGVIYMHCTTEDRIGVGPSRQNFHTFRKFCGDSSLRDILIVANKWSGDRQGSAHKDEFFGPAIDKGARMLSHDGSQASAHAIIRHLIDRESTTPPVQGHSSTQKTDHTLPTAGVGAVRQLTGQVEHHTKTFGELCQGIDAATLAEDKETKETLQEEAKTSLKEIERIRRDLEQIVTNIATENSRLEDENLRYRHDFSTQRAESELRVRLLGEERRARELAEAERCRTEAQLAEERALRERENMERESLREHAGQRYGKLLTCGALVFALLCVSRFVFDGSTP